MHIPLKPNFALRTAASVLAALGTLLLCIVLAPEPALALPEGRVYEMVSPVYKNGHGVNGILAVAPDGESVAFVSTGAFSGDPLNSELGSDYVARRGVSGWSTTSSQPPASVISAAAVQDFSSTLGAELISGVAGPSKGSAEAAGTEFVFLSHGLATPDLPEYFGVAGDLKTIDDTTINLGYLSASEDLSHIIFHDGAGKGEQLLPEAEGAPSPPLYDLTAAGGGGASSVRLVGLNNQGKLLSRECSVVLGAASGKQSPLNAVAADGREIFFTPDVGGGVCASLPQLFVRIDGERTLEVSRPISSRCAEVPCKGVEEVAANRAPSEFQGANEAGTRVFFTTAQQLVSGDTDTGNDLYMASIGCAGGEAECAVAKREVTSLTQVSHAASGEPAEVQGVVALAPDGSHVYFVARGALSEGPNAEGHLPVKGADNLYVYDSSSSGRPVFVADLCSGPERSGVVEDIHCPSDLNEEPKNDQFLWLSNAPEAQVADEGEFLVFSSYGQLEAGDTDTAKDVYRYDAETGLLTRVSVGEDGYDANGNDDAFDASIRPELLKYQLSLQRGMQTRAVSEDGSRIVFETAGPLSEHAINGLANVYEWHLLPGSGEGRVSLVSTGSSSEAVEEAVIDPSGEDIFFKTGQGLVPQDTDGAADVYDARLGGGFSVSAAEPEPCEGEACYGPLTNPAPLLVPGSVSQAPGGNFAAPAPVSAPVPAEAKPKAKPVKCRRGYVKKQGRCLKKPKSKRAKKSNRRAGA